MAETRPRCPTCRKTIPETDRRHGAFCSERCQMIDLGRWLGGDYRIPVTGIPGDEPEDA